METAPDFVLFGSAHLAVMALTVAVPLLLAWATWRAAPGLRRWACGALALVILGSWLWWYGIAWEGGWLALRDGLPMELCDWAAIATLLALAGGWQRAYELAYFWALSGTLQALVTPNLNVGFPDPRFLAFMLFHGGIIAGVLYMTVGQGRRPVPASLPWVVFCSFVYLFAAGLADWLIPGADYGFVAAKPAAVSVMQFLPAWPWYIPVLVVLGFVSIAVYYAPFFVIDRFRARRALQGEPARQA